MPTISETVFPMVVHKAYGGYGLSRAASEEVARRKGMQTRVEDGFLYVGDGYDSVADTVPRHDPDLVAVVREMGEAAGKNLKVVNVSVTISIEERDG